MNLKIQMRIERVSEKDESLARGIDSSLQIRSGLVDDCIKVGC